MKRTIIKLKDGTVINIPADAMDTRNEWLFVWNGEDIVAVINREELKYCFIGEQKGDKP